MFRHFDLWSLIRSRVVAVRVVLKWVWVLFLRYRICARQRPGRKGSRYWCSVVVMCYMNWWWLKLRIILLPIKIIRMSIVSFMAFFEYNSTLGFDAKLAEMKNIFRFVSIATHFVATATSSSTSFFAAKFSSRATESPTSAWFSVKSKLCDGR